MATNADRRFRSFAGKRSEGLRPHEVVAPAKKRPQLTHRGRERGRVAQLHTERNRRRKDWFEAIRKTWRLPDWMKSLHNKE